MLGAGVGKKLFSASINTFARELETHIRSLVLDSLFNGLVFEFLLDPFCFKKGAFTLLGLQDFIRF